MKKSIQNRIRKGLFPEMPQSFADRLTGALKIGGAFNADQRSADEAPTAPVLPERSKRRFPFGKIFNGVAAAVLAALCIVIAVFGIILPNVQKTHGAARPDGRREDFPVGKWTLAEVGQNGEAVDPGEIGLWMELAFSDDGSVTVKTVTGGAEGQYVYRYTFADNAIELTAEGGEIPVLPASGTYDPETDTLRFADEDGARAIFRRKAAASLQASMLGVWSHSYTKYEGIGLTIKKNGAFLTYYTCVSETDTPLIYTVENNVITFTGDGISFTAVYLADEDALSVTWNDKTLQFERSPSLESPWGTWTMTEMILKDGTRFSADEIGSESTLYFAYLGPLTYTWNVNGNVSQTEYEFWIKGNSIPLRLADGTDVNDPEITYDLETDTLRLFTANDGRTYVYVRMPDLAGKWTLTEVEANGSKGDPALIGMEMALEFQKDGSVMVTTHTGYDEMTGNYAYRYAVSENTVTLTAEDASVPVLPPKGVYDPETDTLRFAGAHGDGALIFTRMSDAVIPEIQTTDAEIAATAKRNAAGIWKSEEGDTLWITDDGTARSEALSGLTGNLTYTVEDGTLHFSLTGTDFTFTARYDESKDTLSVTANGNTKLYSRVTGSIAGKWTMTGIDLLTADFSAEKTGWKMYLEIFDDGSMIAVKITDDAAERTAYRLLHVDENTFTFEEDTGAVVTSSLPPWKIVYDAATDTLRMEYDFGINPTPVFSRTPDAVIPALTTDTASDLAGMWTRTRSKYASQGTDYSWIDVDMESWQSWLEITADGHAHLTEYDSESGEALHADFSVAIGSDGIQTDWESCTGMWYDTAADTICMEIVGRRRDYYSRTPDAVIPAGERKEITELRKQYPEYFGLDTSKGLKVYVWQMAESDYSCALLSGTDERSEIEIGLQCKGTTIEQMRLILSTYGLEEKDIEIVPFENPISSYAYEIDKMYTAQVTWLLLGTPIEDGGDLFHTAPIDTAVYDVDGDGQLETCVLSNGPTSGLFTVVFHVYRNGTLVYLNTFNMAYGELYLSRASDGLVLERVSPGHDNVPLDAATYRITIENGVIVLTDGSTGEAVDYWGTADTTWNMKVPAATPEKRFGGAWYCYDKEVASYPGYDELLLIEFDLDGRHVSFTEDRKHYEGYTWQTDADDPNVLILTNETTGDVRRATLETDAKLRFETDLNARGDRSEWTYYSLPILSAEDLPYGEPANLWQSFISAHLSGTDPAWCNGPFGMFDLDGDGKPELIRLTWDETSRKMTVEAFTNHNRAAYTGYIAPGDFGTNEGELYYTVENVTDPLNLILIDLDPSDGHVNLLVSGDTENGGYIYELHVENGVLMCGHVIDGYCFLADSPEQELMLATPTDLLGAKYGYREVKGEALEPADEWLQASALIERIMFGKREENIGDGTLLHLVRALPCEIDGKKTTLKPGVYMHLREWNEAMTEIVFLTEDDRWITVYLDGTAPYTVGGVPLADYFDNAPKG